MSSSVAAACCVHDDAGFLRDSIASFQAAVPVFAFVNTVATEWRQGDWEFAAKVAAECGATVVVGEWPAAVLHRQGAIPYLLDRGFTHAILPEASEVIDSNLLDSVCQAAEQRLAERVYVERAICWKTPGNVLARTEDQLLMVDIAQVWPDDVSPHSSRLYGGGRSVLLNAEHGVLYYMTR